jgi:hypothetical protein
MRIAAGLVVLLLGAASVSATLSAQTVSLESAGKPLIAPPDTVRTGARVRLWVRQRDEAAVDLVGTVRIIGRDSLFLAPSHTPEIAVPLARLRHVEISDGPRSAPRWRSTLIGAAFGALAGGVAGVIIGNAAKKNAAGLGEAGLAGGFVVGGVIGYMLPGENWHDGVLPGAGRPARAVGSPSPGS